MFRCGSRYFRTPILLIAFLGLSVITNNDFAVAISNNAEDPVLEKIKDVSDKTSQTIEYLKDLHLKKQDEVLLASKPDEKSFRITQLIETKGRPPLVVVDGGSGSGIVDGAILDSFRKAVAPSGKKGEFIWVKTGAMKVIELKDSYCLAEVTSNGTLSSQSFFPRFPTIMSGDWVMENQVRISRNPIVTPTKSLMYDQIFQDPKAYPTTFELSEEGKERLASMASYFKGMKLPLLMVEAYTDDNGPSDANQVESYQRALTVRQYLVTELGFDAARVVAIGYGESEPINTDYTAGYIEENRRIVFKVRPLGNAKP